MTTYNVNAPTLADTQYSGDCPAAHAHGKYTFASSLVTTKVKLMKLFAGTKIYGTKMINAALGGSTTVAVGWEYVNAEAGGAADALIPATSTSSAAKTDSIVAPFTLAYDAWITASTAGATATGQLDVVVDFEHRGNL